MKRQRLVTECRKAVASVFNSVPDEALDVFADWLDHAHTFGEIDQWNASAAKAPEAEVADILMSAEYLRKAADCLTGKRGGRRGVGLSGGLALQPFAYDILSAIVEIPSASGEIPASVRALAKYSLMYDSDAIGTVVSFFHWQAASLESAAREITENGEFYKERIEKMGHIKGGNTRKKVVAHAVADQCCRIVVLVTGKPPTVGRNVLSENSTGPLYLLVKAVFSALEIEADPTEMSKAARKRYLASVSDG